VDLKPFTFDRITFEMEYLALPADRSADKAAKVARQAPHDVWKLIEERLGGEPDWNARLGDQKKELDKDINTIVQNEIIEPFTPPGSSD
jgi:hypothetical protein